MRSSSEGIVKPFFSNGFGSGIAQQQRNSEVLQLWGKKIDFPLGGYYFQTLTLRFSVTGFGPCMHLCLNIFVGAWTKAHILRNSLGKWKKKTKHCQSSVRTTPSYFDCWFFSPMYFHHVQSDHVCCFWWWGTAGTWICNFFWWHPLIRILL